GVKSDGGAHAGIVVSEKGFTKPAARIASNNNVQIFTFQDTRNADWQCRLSVPLFVEEWVLVPTVFRLTRKDGLTTDITDDRTISLTDSKTGQGVVAAASVRRLWEEGSDKRPGDVCYDFPVGANASLLEDRLQIEIGRASCR